MYSLADVDGVICVAGSWRADDEPVVITNYWPTEIKTWAFLKFYSMEIGQLALVKVRNPSVPGMFLCNLELGDDTRLGWNASFTLVDMGRTQSVKVDKMPVPPPATSFPVKYERGSWWVELKSGWKRR